MSPAGAAVVIALGLAAAGLGCGGDAPSAPDGAVAVVDAGPVDARPPVDASTVDARPPVDASTVDAVPPVDASVVDASTVDAVPPVDASVVDATPPVDASVVDAAITDGPPTDGGPVVPPDVDGRITINELMAANALSLRDETGVAGDWLELYNPTSHELALDGYTLTDDLARPGKFALRGVVLPAGGHLVLWADHRPEVGPRHLGFRLHADGGAIGLARPDGTYIDRVHYGAQAMDFTSARSPDGSSAWLTTWTITPGAANPAGPGQPMGLEVVGAPPEEAPAAGDLTETLLGYDQLPELELVVSAAGAAALGVHPFVDVPANLVFRGRSYGPVGLRLKGQNSFLPFTQKPSLRINIDEYVVRAKFWGVKDLTLDNMSDDLSMMHERLGYWVMRQAGVTASRSNHLRLTINGQPYGLYANVETIKHQLIGRWFSDDTGPLFEAADVDFVAPWVPAYELEAGPDTRTLLAGLADALTLPSADAAIAAAEAFVDMDRFLRYWAVCSVIGQFDAFPYSNPGDDYYVYADPVSHRLVFLPWGMDETFYSSSIDVVQTPHSVLAARCKASPACFQRYVAATWSVQTLTEQRGLAAERVRVIEQIAPFVAADPRRPYTLAEVEASQSALFWFITERRAKLGTMLPPP